MLKNLVIVVNFFILDYLWYVRIDEVSVLFYIFYFVIPLIELVYFYRNGHCGAVKLLIALIMIHTLFFDLILAITNQLTLTFALVNVSFVVMLYLFTYIHHILDEGCICAATGSKRVCTMFLLATSVILSLVYEHVLRHYVIL